MFVNFIPFLTAPLYLGKNMHIYTLLHWGMFIVLDIHDGHSGYEFPWSLGGNLPFACAATYHDYHHSDNIGNYGGYFTFWDSVFDDNKAYYGTLKTEENQDKKVN